MERKVNDFGYAMEVLGCKPFIKKKKYFFIFQTLRIPSMTITVVFWNQWLIKCKESLFQ